MSVSAKQSSISPGLLQKAGFKDIAVLLLAVATLTLMVGATCLGAINLTPFEVLTLIGNKIGITNIAIENPQAEIIFWKLRLPRVLMAVIVGAALAQAGAAMQGLFRNPLAEPGLLGVSAGAALAAVVTILFASWLPQWLPVLFLLPVAAFFGGIIATVTVYKLSQINGQSQVGTMLLAGIAINALAGAGIGLCINFADDAQLRSITFWNLGSLAGATWQVLGILTPIVIGGGLLLYTLGRRLDAFLLGEAEALHLGINVEQTKLLVVGIAAMLTGTAVAFCGVIGFIGLVVPHLIRLSLGPSQQRLVLASGILGGFLLLAGDLGARTVIAPAELPIGILTSLIGGPFFIWLLLRQKNRL
ncbi:MAG: iron ABC transporter permease [Bacteroidota bacterium]